MQYSESREAGAASPAQDDGETGDGLVGSDLDDKAGSDAADEGSEPNAGKDDAGDDMKEQDKESTVHVGSTLPCQWRDGKFYGAEVVEKRLRFGKADEFEFYVHYDGFNRRLDEWITLDRMDLEKMKQPPDASARRPRLLPKSLRPRSARAPRASRHRKRRKSRARNSRGKSNDKTMMRKTLTRAKRVHVNRTQTPVRVRKTLIRRTSREVTRNAGRTSSLIANAARRKFEASRMHTTTSTRSRTFLR